MGGADENGQESGCSGGGEDHFGILGRLILQKSGAPPRALNVIGQGTPTNFLGTSLCDEIDAPQSYINSAQRGHLNLAL